MEPGGLWDADRYEIRALLERNGEPAGELPLRFAGEVSRFAADLVIDRPGVWQATVYAYDPANGNTGIDRVTFLVAE